MIVTIVILSNPSNICVLLLLLLLLVVVVVVVVVVVLLLFLFGFNCVVAIDNGFFVPPYLSST